MIRGEKFMANKTYLIEGLHCANCALKIENEYKRLPYIEDAVVNPVTSKAILDFKGNDLDYVFILNEIDKIAASIEKGVKVKEIDGPIKCADVRGDCNCCGSVKSCSCCGSSEGVASGDDNKSQAKTFIIKLLLSLIFAFSTFFLGDRFKLIAFIISYLIIGGDVLLTAGNNISKGKIFDENFLMSIATIGAFVIGEYPEAIGVMVFYQIGEYLQGLAVQKSRQSITKLMDIRPDYANLRSADGSITVVKPENVNVDDIIVIKPGEKIPLDGIILNGESQVDTSSLTGESVPRVVRRDSEVMAGSINKTGLLEVRVRSSYSESTVSKILDMVENASNRKSPTEKFISRFARVYTPIVVFSALGIAVIPSIIFGQDFGVWIYRALSFLVVSCPCALVISVPLTFFAGIGGASRKGILVKGGNCLEDLGKAEIVVFDKTGTLTEGSFEVTKISPVDGFSEEKVLEAAAYAEFYSNHPIGKSVVSSYMKLCEISSLDKSRIKSFKEEAGRGVKISLEDRDIYAGNYKYMEEAGVDYIPCNDVGTIVYLAIDGSFIGSIVISDKIKEQSKKALEDLKSIGMKKTVMLTGDNGHIAQYVGETLKIDEVYAELLPDQKVSELERVTKSMSPKGKAIFVGDGINDAPVLTLSDIGIAMGGVGSDAAIEASDVVIMSDDPSKIAEAILLGRRTSIIAGQNIVISLIIKVAILLLIAMGYGNMWMAVFADVGVTLIAVLNSIRAIR